MIPYRQMRVVGLQGVGWTTKHSAHVECVINAGKEVSVIADLHGKVRFSLMFGEQRFLLEDGIGFQDLGI